MTRQTDLPWRLMDHPADLRIEVHGKDVPDLFLNAAKALTDLLRPNIRPVPTHTEDLVLESSDYETLLVDWLREILFYHEAKDLVLADAQIKELTPTRLVVRVGWDSRSGGGATNREIKAVTYHGVSLQKEPHGYATQILFDI